MAASSSSVIPTPLAHADNQGEGHPRGASLQRERDDNCPLNPISLYRPRPITGAVPSQIPSLRVQDVPLSLDSPYYLPNSLFKPPGLFTPPIISSWRALRDDTSSIQVLRGHHVRRNERMYDHSTGVSFQKIIVTKKPSECRRRKRYGNIKAISRVGSAPI
ncbi:hypothetical protein TNCV_3458441 [Trichonephila clavipes]|nr:hypothetical protein TNCV_3458441 [Trichonephila clavipes]